ncbi:acetyltransferase [Frankia sp. Cr1]|uniref:acetyltransferase n=1 Tax=Frankia sp. Cr1 TaxID=3073931 RepID=UPI002AD51930|nr:acetyltransferase [Frankia sp. Cr1]
MTTDQNFDEWAIIELFGHVRRAGRVREWEVAGHGFLRLDIPDGGQWVTQFVNPKSIYALTPTTEKLARAAATRWQPEPVHPWELPAVTDSDDNEQDLIEVDDEDDEEIPF